GAADGSVLDRVDDVLLIRPDPPFWPAGHDPARTDLPECIGEIELEQNTVDTTASPMRTLLMPDTGVTAVILAAGVARRLAPLTDHTQKALLPVGGRPILAWMLEALHAVGVRRVVIVVGHCADQVAALTTSAPPGMT